MALSRRSTSDEQDSGGKAIRRAGLSPARCVAVFLALALGATLLPQTAGAQGDRAHVDPSRWWPQVERADETVRSGRWKAGRRQVDRLTEEVLGSSWFGPDLRKILAQAAFLKAVVEANLENDREAIWYWHVACNLDFRLRTTDFEPWGEAGDLLLEHPLRQQGAVPVLFDPPVSHGDGPVTRPGWPRDPVTPTILNNTGAAQEHQGDFEVELIIDQDGRPHYPVVISTHIHPVITLATLRALLIMKPFDPGTVGGAPRDMITRVRVQYHVERW